jgi:hypothetical protein
MGAQEIRYGVEAVEFKRVGLGWLNWHSLSSRSPVDGCERDDNDLLFPHSFHNYDPLEELGLRGLCCYILGYMYRASYWKHYQEERSLRSTHVAQEDEAAGSHRHNNSILYSVVRLL